MTDGNLPASPQPNGRAKVVFHAALRKAEPDGVGCLLQLSTGIRRILPAPVGFAAPDAHEDCTGGQNVARRRQPMQDEAPLAPTMRDAKVSLRGGRGHAEFCAAQGRVVLHPVPYRNWESGRWSAAKPSRYDKQLCWRLLGGARWRKRELLVAA